MTDLTNWVAANWKLLVVPASVFVTVLVVTLWFRRFMFQVTRGWHWPANERVRRALRFPSLVWCILFGFALAVAVSALPPDWKMPVTRGLWSLFVVSLAFAIATVATTVTAHYGAELKLPESAVTIVNTASRVVVGVLGALVLLDLWGAPSTPVIVLLVAIIVAVLVAFRDVFPNIAAGFQLNARAQIKVGDYIKLDSGEEGYITDMGWRNTCLDTLDDKMMLIPNTRIVRATVTNYGRPLKKAQDPFNFYSRTHLSELTGLKAHNLRELAGTLRTSPDAVVYYHTHRFLEEHHYLTPEPSNDFALWVRDELGEEVLAERLASIDTFGFPTLAGLRDGLVRIMEEHLASGAPAREAAEGNGFYFMKTVSVIFATPYVVHDLREFVEALRKISLGSLYYHVFESRLRLGRGLNDFTIWLKDNLGETELGEQIGRLDPYTYTLEGLRSSLIQLIEKRIK